MSRGDRGRPSSGRERVSGTKGNSQVLDQKDRDSLFNSSRKGGGLFRKKKGQIKSYSPFGEGRRLNSPQDMSLGGGRSLSVFERGRPGELPMNRATGYPKGRRALSLIQYDEKRAHYSKSIGGRREPISKREDLGGRYTSRK